MNWNWNSEKTPKSRIAIDDLSVFRTDKPQKNEITEGMTPIEISEIVSDHLIGLIRKQFAEGKRQFLESAPQPEAS